MAEFFNKLLDGLLGRVLQCLIIADIPYIAYPAHRSPYRHNGSIGFRYAYIYHAE